MQPHDPRIVFHQRFADLVAASGLSLREIERRTKIRRTTVDGWKHGTLPNDGRSLITVARVLYAAAGDAGGARRADQEWTRLLREAKDARDERAGQGSARTVTRAGAGAAGQRARTIDATTRAIDTFSRLRELNPKPDADRDRRDYRGKDVPELTGDEQAAVEEWGRQRDDLLREVYVATLDIGDAMLRSRLREAHQTLQLWRGPMKYALQGEHETRYIVTEDALEAIGAFRRGDPAPEASGDYRSTVGFALDWRDEWESNAAR